MQDRETASPDDSGTGAGSERRRHLGRRAFVGAVAAALVSGPVAPRAQGQRTARVGYFGSADNPNLPVLLDGLSKLGWIEGRTMIFHRVIMPAPVDTREQSRLLDDLLAFGPDVIVVSGTTRTPMVLERTRTIPVIFANVGDPVAKSWSRAMRGPEETPPERAVSASTSPPRTWGSSPRSFRSSPESA